MEKITSVSIHFQIYHLQELLSLARFKKAAMAPQELQKNFFIGLPRSCNSKNFQIWKILPGAAIQKT